MIIIIFFILCVLLYRIVPKKIQFLSAILIAFLMSLLAFNLSDTNQYDLIAHRILYDTLQEGGLPTAQIYSSIDRSPLYIWMMYFLSLLGDNRYTTAIPTFVGYFILVFLLYKTSNIHHFPKKYQLIFLTFLLFTLPWQDYSAGLRGALAYSLCVLGLYYEFKRNNKYLGYILYIAPIFIHQASIIFIVLRLFIYFIKILPSSKIYIYALCLLAGNLAEFMGPLINTLADVTGLRILSIVSDSFNSYVIDGTELYEVSIVILRVLAVLLVYFATKRYKESNDSESDIYSIYTMLMLLSIGFVWQYDIVCRYTVACLMMAPLIFYRCRKEYIPLFFVFAMMNIIRYYDSYYSKWEIMFW